MRRGCKKCIIHFKIKCSASVPCTFSTPSVCSLLQVENYITGTECAAGSAPSAFCWDPVHILLSMARAGKRMDFLDSRRVHFLVFNTHTKVLELPVKSDSSVNVKVQLPAWILNSLHFSPILSLARTNNMLALQIHATLWALQLVLSKRRVVTLMAYAQTPHQF